MADLSTHVEYPTGSSSSSSIALTGRLTWHKLQELYAVEDGVVLEAPSSKDTLPEYEAVPHMQPFVTMSSNKIPKSTQYVAVFRMDPRSRKVNARHDMTSMKEELTPPSPWALRFPVEGEKCFLLYDARRRIIYIGPHRSMSAFTVGAHPEESMFSEDFGQEPTDALLQYGFEEGHVPVITKDVLGEALYKAALLQLHPIELYLPF